MKSGLQHGDEVRVDQRSRHAHCIQRGAAQLLGNTVGNKHRHEVERNVCQLAEQRIGRSILECRVCQRCQQQEHLEHTARNQTGDQRSDRCRNKTNHVVCNGLCTLLFGLARLLCRCFVRDNAARLIASGLIDLAGFCIHGDHVLAEHHLKFVGGEHHAQNALALLDGFHLDRRLIFDDKAQTGRAVGDVFDVRGSSTQFNEFRCYFTGIHKTTSFHFYRVILTFRQILNRLIKKMFCVQEGLS